MSEIKCPTCGESEPGTGNCGTSDSDTKALCKVQSECSCRNESQECTEASNCRVLKMFEPTITAVAKGEPAHFRAVLCSEQQNQAIGVVPKVVGFVDKKAAEQFILEKRDFQGWRYNLEPLYTEAPAEVVRELVEAAQKIVDRRRRIFDKSMHKFDTDMNGLEDALTKAKEHGL